MFGGLLRRIKRNAALGAVVQVLRFNIFEKNVYSTAYSQPSMVRVAVLKLMPIL